MADRKPMRVLANSQAVIDALAERGDLSPAELAEATGLPRPSVYRFIEGLKAVGMATTTADNRARLSVKWLHLADAARDAMSEWSSARGVLDELAARTEQTVFLTVPRGDEAVCIDWAPGRGIGVLTLSPGRSLPLYAGGAGRLVLAHLRDLDGYLADDTGRRPLTARTMTDAAALRADVRRTREQGYTLSLDDATIGIGAIALPILDGNGELLGCLSVAGRSVEIEERQEEFLAAARAAVAVLEQDAAPASQVQSS
ncbi:DNA-binding IclR family transcriptional regulator [Curtobacterium pusillum]|uniref:DNA-binding IclR family transcriptional regulator n=1 Tax=Curtobacterium pusillum TaxID=69373 RepID=A0AAW3TB86_9MICO|nr:DNA-binding IclR family transcriptional regulator [Curtobacterium pusillum]